MTTIKLGFAGNASGNHENNLECLSNPDFEPVLGMLGVVIGSKVSIPIVGELYKSIKSKANGGVLQSLKSTGRAKKNTGTLVHLFFVTSGLQVTMEYTLI
eukprot:scaffold12256_cov103-Alexandrium_tamarense.AAC.1